MRVQTIFRLWLPLAISFELMMLEGPVVQSVISHLPYSKTHLAAWGLTLGLSLLIESPVIMLLATTIALLNGEQSFRALKKFMLWLCLSCTVITALIAFTPLFDLIAARLMGQPDDIVRAAKPAMQIMLLWTAAIAWRRFYQGVLVKCGQTRWVSWGTAVRLSVVLISSFILLRTLHLPGVQIGAIVIMAAVISEAIATTFFAAHALDAESFSSLDRRNDEPPLSQKAIFKFHAPLAATTLLTLLAQPLNAAALARLPSAEETLAAWPIAFLLALVVRGGALALQEIAVAQSGNPAAHDALKRFSWLVGIVTTAVLALIAFTPLLDYYLNKLIKIEPELIEFTRVGVIGSVFTPLLTAVSSWARGRLVAKKRTQAVYLGMAINLGVNALLLFLGVLLKLNGMAVAAGAFTLSCFAEYLYLSKRASEIKSDPDPAPISSPEPALLS